MSVFGESHQVHCVSVDLSKPFNKVKHNLLAAKLPRLMVPCSVGFIVILRIGF